MGFMKNISNLFKPDDTYEDENEFGEEEYEEEAPVKESRPASASRPAGVSSNASLEMKIIKPFYAVFLKKVGDDCSICDVIQ